MNHPAATETMEFQIRPIAEKGSSSCQKRCHAEKRLIAQASRSSRGMLFSEE